MIDRTRERTGFQEARPYGPRYDLRTDFVMAYGIGRDMPERVKAWRDKGYVVHLMTGVSWGEYVDFLDGKFDGRSHREDGQVKQSGKDISHGVDVPYMVPSIAFADYLAQGLKAAVDAGVEAIHLEEPEFWADAGYSEAFKREWELYYNEPWQAPHTSPDAQYRASKLKLYLYTRTLDHLCSRVKEYAKTVHGRNLRFYVPTHSLINYSQWRIVSPESRLIDIPTCDGYIAQIWTGTARSENMYAGKRAERTFETAYLEYGMMQELVRGTGRRMWFLHDPIEDNPRYDWMSYRMNYYCTLVASLLHPGVSHFEICPWPARVFNGKYMSPDGSGKKVEIPEGYNTELQTIFNTLSDMDQPDVQWDEATTGVGVLIGDSAMFQRAEPVFSLAGGDAESLPNRQDILDLSAFYGMALPPLKHGIPIRPVQLDNLVRYPGYLDDYRVLFLSYEFMKPERADIHLVLAQWVLSGSALIYVGDGSDPFHNVREWWNQGKRKYDTPAQHLFETLGLGKDPEEGVYSVGKGVVVVSKANPVSLARSAEGAEACRSLLKRAITALGDPKYRYIENNYLKIRRGPYVAAACLDESCCPGSLNLNGLFIDLTKADLPVITQLTLSSGERGFVRDLNYDGEAQDVAAIIASSSRIEEWELEDDFFRFTSSAPEGVKVSTRLRLPAQPKNVSAAPASGGEAVPVRSEWDEVSKTVLLRYPGDTAGITVEVKW